MSRGLGRVERGVLEVVRALPHRTFTLDDLASLGKGGDRSRFESFEEYLSAHPATYSEYESTRRAVRSLQRKGLVRVTTAPGGRLFVSSNT